MKPLFVCLARVRLGYRIFVFFLSFFFEKIRVKKKKQIEKCRFDSSQKDDQNTTRFEKQEKEEAPRKDNNNNNI